MTEVKLKDVQAMIKKLEEAGANPIVDGFVIIAHPNAEFEEDVLFPLPIVQDRTCPFGTTYLSQDPNRSSKLKSVIFEVGEVDGRRVEVKVESIYGVDGGLRDIQYLHLKQGENVTVSVRPSEVSIA